ncbi:MAG: metal-dependent transcriptional regulator [Bacteroidia bacterium]|nr:metal-dependent transcriptional regulator [Bacteroidia bacterium]
MHSFTEENYLKAIYTLAERSSGKVSTTGLSRYLQTTPASVTDMLKKLSEKKLIAYTKYRGVSLSSGGRKIAIGILRKHRLWEYFLVHKLGFKWDEVHDIAEELEHINSDALIARLDAYLRNPSLDPHGDPIPDEHGTFPKNSSLLLSNVKSNSSHVITGVMDHQPLFLRYLEKSGLVLGKRIKVTLINAYDQSMQLEIQGVRKTAAISHEVARNILVSPYRKKRN